MYSWWINWGEGGRDQFIFALCLSFISQDPTNTTHSFQIGGTRARANLVRVPEGYMDTNAKGAKWWSISLYDLIRSKNLRPKKISPFCTETPTRGILASCVRSISVVSCRFYTKTRAVVNSNALRHA